MAGFLPTYVVKRFLQFEPDRLREIALEIRSIVAEIAPHAMERVLARGLTYHDPSRGGPVKAGICGITLHDDHVRLHFIHGAFLEDPLGLLEGDRLAKRFMRIHSFQDAPWEEISVLIRRSARFRPTANIKG
ncbi:MAG: DUF1801 domain-containing protein [Anaerolineales bacterium]|nr:MAG: DUF1801 domain-containing protein [Anaerolineales bacterium]